MTSQENRPRPPAGPAARLKGEASPARCPFCGGADTELYALFGSQLSTSQYYCRACRTAFEQLKWSSTQGLGTDRLSHAERPDETL